MGFGIGLFNLRGLGSLYVAIWHIGLGIGVIYFIGSGIAVIYSMGSGIDMWYKPLLSWWPCGYHRPAHQMNLQKSF